MDGKSRGDGSRLVATAAPEWATSTHAHFAHTGSQLPIPHSVAAALLVNNPQTDSVTVRVLCVNTRQQGVNRGNTLAGKSAP